MKYCYQCGKPNEDINNLCEKCGYGLWLNNPSNLTIKHFKHELSEELYEKYKHANGIYASK